jgi:hypothetical protein
MSPTELVIHDLADALCNLQVKNINQRRAIYIKSLESLVNFAISESQVAPIRAAQEDMRKVGEILAKSKV